MVVGGAGEESVELHPSLIQYFRNPDPLCTIFSISKYEKGVTPEFAKRGLMSRSRHV